MNKIKFRLEPAVVFFQRYPRLIAVISFFMGVASFFFINRQKDSVGIIAIFLLISWVWLLLENLLTKKINGHFGITLPPVLSKYCTQLIHQESLFFVLPFFIIGTTWNSGQAAFTGFVITLALLSVIDPIYYRWLSDRRVLFMAFHTLTLFIVLLTALPIILHLTSSQSYLCSILLAVFIAIPSLHRYATKGQGWRGVTIIALVISLMAAALWYGRIFVPPPILRLTDLYVAAIIDEDKKQPGVNIKVTSEHELHRNGLYAYTAIQAPRGLNEKIYHIWRHNGKEVDRIAINIEGGRKAGYRTWSHKNNFPTRSVGKWQVQVVTEVGQMIGVLRFRVTP